MKKILISFFVLISFLLNLIYVGAETKSKKLLKAYEIFNTKLISPDPKVRLEGADEIAQLGYDGLKDFSPGSTWCGDLFYNDRIAFQKACTSMKPCSYFNHGIYHIINLYGVYAKKEMDPKSEYFTQNKDYSHYSPALSSLRWMIYNQFENPFHDTIDETPPPDELYAGKLVDMAYSIFDKVTRIKINDLSDLKPFKPLSARNEEIQWFYKEIITNGFIYASPVIYYILADKSGKITYQLRVMPFKEGGYGLTSNPLHIRWVSDIAIFPGTSIGILRKDGECCGDDRNYFYFMDLKNNLTILGSLILSDCSAVEKLSTIERVKKAMGNKLSFPLEPKKGKIIVNGKSIGYEIKPAN